MSKNQHLEIEIRDGRLVISIGIDLLCSAIQSEIQDFRIVSNDEFVKEVINELEAEEEDGTTLVHKMLDTAANQAIENGSEHVKEVEDGLA